VLIWSSFHNGQPNLGPAISKASCMPINDIALNQWLGKKQIDRLRRCVNFSDSSGGALHASGRVAVASKPAADIVTDAIIL
jgi:hypothetical protein